MRNLHIDLLLEESHSYEESDFPIHIVWEFGSREKITKFDTFEEAQSWVKSQTDNAFIFIETFYSKAELAPMYQLPRK